MTEEVETHNQLIRENELHDLKVVLSTPNGRAFVWRHLSKCGIYHSSYSPEVSQIYYRSGKRDIGLDLLSDINALDPTLIYQIAKENNNDSN